MAAPIWMASPPEVHSALLSSGPGPASLFAAAGAWSSLSAEYAAAADELTALLASVEAGSWEGSSAVSYVGAHLPYLAWLARAGLDSAAAATQHEAAGTAYTAALAAMPTLAELAANHAVHAVLTVTNFFGVNTIPIALNEADYVRMWIQAATTMGTYQAVSDAAVSGTPQSPPAPQIVKSQNASAPTDPLQQIDQVFQQISSLPRELLQRLLAAMGYDWDPANGTINGIPYLDYNNPLTLIYWITRDLSYGQDFNSFVQLLLTNPVLLLQYLGTLTPAQVALYLSLHPLLAIAIALGPALSTLSALPAAAAAASVAAVAALAVLPVASVPVVAPVLAPIVAVSHVIPAIAPTATLAGSVGTGAPATPATAAGTVASSAPPSPAAPAGPGFFPYAVGGSPGTGFDTGHTATAAARARARAAEPDTAAVATTAAARRRRRKRREQDEPMRSYADEFADLDADSSPGASDRGGGPLGFSGTIEQGAARAAGLTVLTGDAFGGGPTVPMVPGTWEPDPPPQD
ncbi:PPE family protein [Mycobacterium sp. 050134]|uniref:PPE family protein n=1 Tax=Mycobacterium sp. 050134 TaxID=3096111 RepID=UPI002EDAF0C7